MKLYLLYNSCPSKNLNSFKVLIEMGGIYIDFYRYLICGRAFIDCAYEFGEFEYHIGIADKT